MALPFDIANFNLVNFAENYNDIFDSTPQDVQIQLKDANGNVSTKTVANRGKFQQQVWSDVGAAAGQFSRSIYVDEINGHNTNSGSSSSPIKDIHLAVGMIPNGGYVDIRLLSDCTWSENTVSSTNKCIGIQLQGKTLNLKSYAMNGDTSKMLLYSILGYSNKVYISGDTNNNSKIVIPPLASGETTFSPSHALFIKSFGVGEPEQSALHFGYTVEIVDNGDFYLIGGGSSNFAFSVHSTIVTNNAGTRTIQDLVSGIVYDANGVPRNLQSNLIF